MVTLVVVSHLDEVSLRKREARLAFTDLKHLWRRHDTRLHSHSKVGALHVTQRTGPPETKYVSTFGVCIISRIWWKNFVSISEVGCKVLGPGAQYSEEALNLNRLRWLGHVLCMPTERLHRWALSFETGSV